VNWRAWVVLTALAVPAAWADRVSIPGADATFETPQGFTALTAEEIAIKFPRQNAPRSAVGDERRRTTVAFELRDIAIPDDALPAVLESMAASLHRAVPGVEWKRRELVQMAGQRWVWLELTSTAIDADIYNIILMTSRKGKMLVFNFSTTKDFFPIHEAALRASIASIALE
jgi:hypothetical protein